MRFFIREMAKRIKAVKCPQCGSTRAKELRPDYYKCSSCQTEFFIDSDDININHKYENPLNKINVKHALISISVIVGCFIFISIVRSVLSPKTFYSQPPSVTIAEEKTDKSVVVWNKIVEFRGFANANGEGMILIIGARATKKDYSTYEDETPSYGIYRATDSSEVAIKPIRNIDNINFTDIIKTKLFENGKIYVIINNKRLFVFDTGRYELDEVQFQSLNLPELAKGVFEIRFEPEEGDGFKVVNELGKKLYYFPIINKVYTEEGYYAARGMKLPNAKKRVGFLFSAKSDDFPDEKIQLIKYYYWWQIGYPVYQPGFRWDKDFGGSGIFTDRSPYRKVLILPYIREKSRMISFSDFTPNRDYISGHVLAYNDQEVLIAFKPTLSGNTIVQILDAATAEIKWTIPADMPYIISDDAVVLKDGYLFTKHEKSWLLNTKNKKGKLIEWHLDE